MTMQVQKQEKTVTKRRGKRGRIATDKRLVSEDALVSPELYPGLDVFLKTSEGRSVTNGEMLGMMELSRNDSLMCHIPGAWKRDDGSYANPHFVWLSLLTYSRTLKGNMTKERAAKLTVVQELASRSRRAADNLGLEIQNFVLLNGEEKERFCASVIERIGELRAVANDVEAFVGTARR